MKKLTCSLVIISLVICFSANASVRSSPQDEQKFKNTNECIDCDLTQTELSYENHDNANLAGSLMVNARLNGAHFNGANFQNTNFQSVHANQLEARNCNFKNANMSKSDLSWAILADGDFSDADLSGVNFANANLYRAKITSEQLKKAGKLTCAILPDGKVYDNDAGTCN